MTSGPGGLVEIEVSDVNQAEKASDEERQVDKLSSLVDLVHLLLQTGLHVQEPDHGGGRVVYRAAYQSQAV